MTDDHTPAHPDAARPPDADDWAVCPACRGTGYRRTGPPPRPCDQCDHAGIVTYRAMWLCAECLTDALAAFHEVPS